MQKAILTLNFWDGMGPGSQNKFLDFIEAECSPWKEFYDDDMTEEGGEDLKKATLQLKVIFQYIPCAALHFNFRKVLLTEI